MKFFVHLKKFLSWITSPIRRLRDALEIRKASRELREGLIAAEAFVTEENAKRILHNLDGIVINSCYRVEWVADDPKIMENKRVAWENRNKVWEEYKKDLNERIEAELKAGEFYRSILSRRW